MEHRETVILGAGLSGLSTALHCGGDYLVLEKEGRVGGLTRTEDIDGFLFNHTGHWLHLRDARVKTLVGDLMGDGMLAIARKARVFSHGVFTEYPFQANLHGLPAQALRECLMGAVEAALRRAAREGARPRNFLEYARHHFGDGIAGRFIVPYNTKLWGVAPTEVTADWCQRFVPLPDVARIVDGALGFSREALGYNSEFLYPREGGIESLPRAMVSRLDQSRILRSTRVRKVNVAERTVEFGEEKVGFEHLVSSIALPELVERTSDAPVTVRTAARRLRCSPLRYMNVALSVENPLCGAHWIYMPEDRFPFYRVGSASNAVPGLAPSGHSSLYVELRNDRPVDERDAVVALASFLRETGSIEGDSQLVFAAFRDCRWGYVIHDRHCRNARARILDWYTSHGVHSIGRYGGWTYNSMEDAILDGMEVADIIRNKRQRT